MMKRWAFLLTLVAGIGLLRPVQAQEQVTCEVTRLGDSAYNGADDIGFDDCENSTVTFKVSSPIGLTYTAYTGPSCNSDSTENCLQIEEQREISTGGTDTFEIDVKALLDDYGKSCILTEQPIRVRIFYYDNTLGMETSKECTEITVDTVGPLPPTNVAAKPGETAIKITWDKVDEDDDMKYEVFYKVVDDCEDKREAFNEALNEAVTSFWESLAPNPDAQVIADAGTVDTNDLDPEFEEPPEDFDGSETAIGDDHTLKNVAKPGEELLISVKAIDSGGNSSIFSEATCVRVIDTYGFCDSTDKCEDGCSVGPIGKEHAHAGAGVVVGLLPLLALVWARRRSRS